MSLSIAFAMITATCTPSASPAETREEVVDTFMNAMAHHDFPTMGKYIKPGAMAVTDTASMDLAQTLSALNPNMTMTVLDKKFNPDKTIVVHFATMTGDDKDEATVSFAQEGGCIVSMTQL